MHAGMAPFHIPHSIVMPVSTAFCDHIGWRHDTAADIHEIAEAIAIRGKQFALTTWDKFITSDKSPYYADVDKLRADIAEANTHMRLYMPFVIAGMANFSKYHISLDHRPPASR